MNTVVSCLLFTIWCILILWLATSKPNPKVVDLPKNRRVLPKEIVEEGEPYQAMLARYHAMYRSLDNKPCDPMWPNELVLAGKLGHAVGLCSGEGVAEI